MVAVRNPLQGQGEKSKEMRRDPYMMDVDRGRNYHSCGDFGYLV